MTTIASNIDSDKYKVGDTKEIKLEGYTNEEENSNGLYTVRIANITSDDPVCKNDNYSKTACGFVIEFEDIITTHDMNPSGEYKDVQYDNGWNVDGYPASAMYKFVNNNIYESLPKDLKEVIIDTKVVSSHGHSDSMNFISTDKLYLLSTKEVYGKEGTTNVINYDTADDQTRQLEYYKDVAKVTTVSYSEAIKYYGKGIKTWWLRSAYFYNDSSFYSVTIYGHHGTDGSFRNFGVAPAFRIG